MTFSFGCCNSSAGNIFEQVGSGGQPVAAGRVSGLAWKHILFVGRICGSFELFEKLTSGLNNSCYDVMDYYLEKDIALYVKRNY